MDAKTYLIGLMSGTSLDGVDAAMVAFDDTYPAGKLIDRHYAGYTDSLRLRLLALHDSGTDELHRSATIANELSDCYADASNVLLERNGVRPLAIACHGQTIRHRPECGYSIQLVNPARLAERTGITVIADFRNRDIAAGGHGAPLVPAFHSAAFHHPSIDRAIVNIGGIANLTNLPAYGTVTGFDCGPGNLLLDAWCLRHTGQPYDADGFWSASGKAIPALLARLLQHPYFNQAAPKSAGREQFSLSWLDSQVGGKEAAADVQATLVELTATSIADAIESHCHTAAEIFICGGGAHNSRLLSSIGARLPGKSIKLTDELGINADWVEAHAFAWLGNQTLHNLPGNCMAVTGAAHPCTLGAIYPA
ncbi:MAG TPA: anhydro-N-acetylmuramic acid kinase [Burkholderiales bacterium]|nr:anhydro-N-acetylmuramic acid kinase [Burkholderiales bacterium]